MPIDLHRVDLLLQYALVAAAHEDDWRDRELGPIHLLKFAYLADWAHARRHGAAFSGAEWQFFHFGPWQAAVHDRIEPALARIDADRKVVSSARFQDDFVRYSLRHDVDRWRDELERDLPLGVYGVIRDAVHRFGGDTAALLRYVYLTPPVLHAAPGEILNLTISDREHQPETVQQVSLTARQKRERKEVLTRLREKVRQRLSSVTAERKPTTYVPPRYDELFTAGTEWLDAAAGEPPQSADGELVISPDVWKSPTRHDPDVP